MTREKFGMIYLHCCLGIIISTVLHWLETDYANQVKAHWPKAKMRSNEIRIEWLRKVIHPCLERREGLGL